VLRRYLPPQHGAWAMLLVPYLAGLLLVDSRTGGTAVLLALLLVAWLAAYSLSYYAFQALKSRRPARYRRQLMAYGVVALAAGGLVVAARPVVLVLAPAFAVGIAVNCWYAWRRQERSMVNDLAAVAQSCLVLPAVLLVAGVVPVDLIRWPVLGSLAVVVAYFIGTVLFVKTVIRERDSVAFRWASVGFHAALALLTFAAAWPGGGQWTGPLGWVGSVSPWPALLFWWLLVRAAWFGGRPLRPATAGALEAVNSALVLIVVALTW
jgi:hypothetical protein